MNTTLKVYSSHFVVQFGVKVMNSKYLIFYFVFAAVRLVVSSSEWRSLNELSTIGKISIVHDLQSPTLKWSEYLFKVALQETNLLPGSDGSLGD